MDRSDKASDAYSKRRVTSFCTSDLKCRRWKARRRYVACGSQEAFDNLGFVLSSVSTVDLCEAQLPGRQMVVELEWSLGHAKKDDVIAVIHTNEL